ncbi:hypothetical protein [Frigoribacterium sp. CG_9.8]|uniref:hypothetical protein n=1 Tax=Frigoribacterium sp. CG_9.8 TaxID=2787733 RepID=UPI0018C9F124|nr:hypothetical protein [Frigoribacterium sp. CG_9.8]MBG6106599.1 hypothetical protein [Frigoribacterium sp. CG_9.8]
MNSPLIRTVIIHNYKPIPGRAKTGGFDFAPEGSDYEADLRVQFDLQTDTAHHDYTPTHEHRLIRLRVPDYFNSEQLTNYIDNLLTLFEMGMYDDTNNDLGKHIPTKEDTHA